MNWTKRFRTTPQPNDGWGSLPDAVQRRAKKARAQGKRATAAPTVAATLLLLGAAVALETRAQAQSARDSTCQVIRGSIVPVCEGEVCIRGSIVGDLHGQFTSRVTSIYPAGSGWLYTAWARIELDSGKGRIETVNYAMTPFDPKGGPDLSRSTEIWRLSEATGVYQDYVGTIVLTADQAGRRTSSYVGRLCHPLAQ